MMKHTVLAGMLLLGFVPMAHGIEFPADPPDIKTPVLYEQMEPWLLELADSHDHITITTEGESAGGRDIHLVTISHGKVESPWKVFAIGVLHGNEHSGKDALLFMIDEIARDPSLLAEDIELYIVPMANPEGVNNNERRNANNTDLNRDFSTILEPETQVLHRIQQRIRAHVVIDCHEYTRDGRHFVREGLKKWPLIALGTANSPYMDQRIVELGERRLASSHQLFQDTDVTFLEYLVGGPPPNEELRPSTPNADDARNGLSSYGSMGFIIEAGIFRGNEDPQADFGHRVSAYRDLIWHLINSGDREVEKQIIEEARRTGPPEFLPTNYFWGTTTKSAEIFNYPALDAETGDTIFVPTANFMYDLVIKSFVQRPVSYAITATHAGVYADLLDRHGIPFEVVDEPRDVYAESVRIVRIEEGNDQVYARYSGRQVMDRGAAGDVRLEKGALIVPLSGYDGRRAAQLLEPMKLYGLYQYELFHDTVDENGNVPVLRMMTP
ncbi:MAG: DUF2817 domain-containing protein [Candidatus Sumerlaeia bacterium]|nr:DUF2817 domain-containing protein [Candidatus Sumerlaeia bacterium]